MYSKGTDSFGEYIFWPDRASAHYAKIVLRKNRQVQVELVTKDENPANVPEVRCMEDFWSVLKRRVYARGWKAKTIDRLIMQIKYCLKKIDQKVVQKLALSTKWRIDRVRRNGVIESLR